MLQQEELIKKIYRSPEKAYQTQSFGVTPRSSVYIYNFHTGRDFFGGEPRAEVITPVDVTITRDDDWSNRGYGNQLIGSFTGRDGVQYSLRFGHFERNFFRVGDRVPKGAVVGIEGTTGFSTGPHLHFEIFRGTINPYVYQYNRDRFLSSFVDPLYLDEIVSLESAPRTRIDIIPEPDQKEPENNEEDMARIQELEAELARVKSENSELRQTTLNLRFALAKAFITNDNRQEVDRLLGNAELDPVINSPSKRGIVGEFYWALLGRDPDKAGYEYHKNLSAVEILRSIAGSYEFSRRINDIIYKAVFNRPIDDGGMRTWARKSPDELIRILKDSEEYKKVVKNEYDRLF